MISALFRSKTIPQTIDDAEFGEIVVRRNANARSVRLRMTEDGILSITLPRFGSLKHAVELVENSREQVRGWQAKLPKPTSLFKDGDRIGKSHTLKLIPTTVLTTTIKKQGLTIVVEYPNALSFTDQKVQKALKPHLEKALQREARAYLPRRLKYLAENHDFYYERVRYGTQKGRWGSCSSTGTISLNVGLMLLDPDLIDYVLIHELCHTKQMNHSTSFWLLVGQCLPDYKARRKRIKLEKPSL